MPQTLQDFIWLLLTTGIAISVCGIIPWLVNKGFNAVAAKITSMEAGITALRVDIQKERENRLVHYGLLEGKLTAHRAICEERHQDRRQTGRRASDHEEWGEQ